MVQSQADRACAFDTHHQGIIVIDAADYQVTVRGCNDDIIDQSDPTTVVQFFEAGQDNTLVGGNKTDIVGITVAVFLYSFPFPIYKNCPDGIGNCSIEICFSLSVLRTSCWNQLLVSFGVPDAAAVSSKRSANALPCSMMTAAS